MEGVWSFGNLVILVHEVSSVSFGVSGSLILKKVRSNDGIAIESFSHLVIQYFFSF